MYITYITSDEYAPYAGISLTSLFESNKDIEYIKVFMCVYDISELNKKKFLSTAHKYGREVEFIYINNFIEKLESQYGIGKFNGSCIGYSRMFPTHIFPKEVDRILYLDSDTVIIGDLSELYETPMVNTALLMAENIDFELYPESLPPNECVATKKSGKNFNTGVILFDIVNYKRYGVEEILKNELLKSDRYAFAEQSISNICIPKNIIGHMHLKYNYFLHTKPRRELGELINIYSRVYNMEELKESTNCPIVIHYLGFQCRAWFKECRSSMKKEYDVYKSMSEWRDVKPKSIYKSPRYVAMGIREKIKTKIIICLWNTKILYKYKIKHNKIAKW